MTAVVQSTQKYLLFLVVAKLVSFGKNRRRRRRKKKKKKKKKKKRDQTYGLAKLILREEVCISSWLTRLLTYLVSRPSQSTSVSQLSAQPS